MSVSIKTKKSKGLDILYISGRLVNIDSEKFQKKLESFCQKRSGDVILDITDVSFIDSFGLGTLVKHHTELNEKGHKLIILNTNTDQNTYIQRLFDITGLDKVMNFVTSL